MIHLINSNSIGRYPIIVQDDLIDWREQETFLCEIVVVFLVSFPPFLLLREELNHVSHTQKQASLKRTRYPTQRQKLLGADRCLSIDSKSRSFQKGLNVCCYFPILFIGQFHYLNRGKQCWECGPFIACDTQSSSLCPFCSFINRMIQDQIACWFLSPL